jgi:hypothetical protein
MSGMSLVYVVSSYDSLCMGPRKTPQESHGFATCWSHAERRRSQAECGNAGVQAPYLSPGFGDFGRVSRWTRRSGGPTWSEEFYGVGELEIYCMRAIRGINNTRYGDKMKNREVLQIY